MMDRTVEAMAWLAAGALGAAAFFSPPLLDTPVPSVEFLGPTIQTEVTLGSAFTPVHYSEVLRREICSGTVTPRWRKAGKDGLPGDLDARWASPPFIVTPADLTSEPADFVTNIPVPPPGEPGLWYYVPVLKPGEDCSSTTPIFPPPHPVLVTESGDSSRLTNKGN